MGLFTKKLSNVEMSAINRLIKIAEESVSIINTTTNPKVFFERLHITLDVLLQLSKYEKYKIFGRTKPSDDYQRIVSEIEDTVNNFIDRSYEHNLESANKLKTEKGTVSRMKKYSLSMFDAFDSAYTFWGGYNGQPHYQSHLYTKANLEHLHELLDKHL